MRCKTLPAIGLPLILSASIALAQNAEIRSATTWGGRIDITGSLQVFDQISVATGEAGVPLADSLDIRATAIILGSSHNEVGGITATDIAESRRGYQQGEGAAGDDNVGGGSHAGSGQPDANGNHAGWVYGNIWSFLPGGAGGNEYWTLNEPRRFGKGGGAIRLVADDIVLNSGSYIRADGGQGNWSPAIGAGAGGSVWLIGKRISIGEGARISASGGAAPPTVAGGGGVIRIAYIEEFTCDGELNVSGYQPGIIGIQRIDSFESRDLLARPLTNPDLNQDGLVNAPDLLIFQSNWQR